MNAPGYPGITPRWTSSAKSGVGTAVNSNSRVWFTVSHGIVNEVYYPDVDQANTRDMGLIVTDGQNFFSEEKRDAVHQIDPIEQGVPGYKITNLCSQGRYRIHKTIVTDPERDVLLQQIHFEPIDGPLSDFHLYALLAPHTADRGTGNDGWTGLYRGLPMLFAQRGGVTMALACSAPFLARTCGFVGVSDGWQDLHAHRRLTQLFPQATGGNIALTGEVDLEACAGQFVLALAFGANAAEAGIQARAGLLRDFDAVRHQYVVGWSRFRAHCAPLASPNREGFDLYGVSTAVLKTHESKRFPGGMIASLSIPWGFAHGDNDTAGYHVVWPRDQVEGAGALLAAGNSPDARRTLFYMMCTQEPDGHWPQNMWVNGEPNWNQIQLDETAFFILLADALRRRNALADIAPWSAIRKAVTFLVGYGPATEQDRWEENSGFSVFTLAVLVAALLAAAEFADAAHELRTARYLRETADTWHDALDRWTYATGTELAKQQGVEGYYVRIAPRDILQTEDLEMCVLKLKNRPEAQSRFLASRIVSPDALALVRYGLCSPHDPRIRNTVAVIDALLKTETRTGPVWHRYNHDGYGEREDGSPFEGVGIGRGWPLLTGERAHYELAAGNIEEAKRLSQVIASQTSPGGLLPEQVWDAPDLPERALRNGCPSGSGMPLVWAHAEYLKLLRSLHDNAVFDTPPQTVQRYQEQAVTSPFVFWRRDYACRFLPAGKSLRIELPAPASIHWTADGWHTSQDVPTRDTGLGIFVADLPTEETPVGQSITFTFRWQHPDRWEGKDYSVQIQGSPENGPKTDASLAEVTPLPPRRRVRAKII